MIRDEYNIIWHCDKVNNNPHKRKSHIYNKLFFTLKLNEEALIYAINRVNGEIIETILVKKERTLIHNKQLILITEKERRLSESWKKRKERTNGQLLLF